jgi:hypothetical protein
MRNANVHPYRQIRAPEEVKRIREAERIDRENRIIADRLRNRVNYICVCFVCCSDLCSLPISSLAYVYLRNIWNFLNI